jgi:hypothetical protein
LEHFTLGTQSVVISAIVWALLFRSGADGAGLYGMLNCG